jgi:hypothetical protein
MHIGTAEQTAADTTVAARGLDGQVASIANHFPHHLDKRNSETHGQLDAGASAVRGCEGFEPIKLAFPQQGFGLPERVLFPNGPRCGSPDACMMVRRAWLFRARVTARSTAAVSPAPGSDTYRIFSNRFMPWTPEAV